MFTWIVEKGPIAHTNKNASPLNPPKHLVWETDRDIEKRIEAAENRAKKDIDRFDSILVHYNEYGSNFIKKGSMCL